uniref:Uncharacterized protein n=1 Tax=Piliocolobus tephrosceles TaxID=591936 RepID=A0A8C9I388_9PRIM
MESRTRGGTVSWNPVVVWCTKCEQQDPRYSPYTLVRITEAEMRAYHRLVGSCIRLEYVAKKGSVECVSLMSAVAQPTNHPSIWMRSHFLLRT